MGLNSGAVIPSMASKLQIGQILGGLQNFEKTQKLLKFKGFILAEKRYKIEASYTAEIVKVICSFLAVLLT